MVLEAGILGSVGGMKVGRKNLCDPLGMRSERKGKPQQVSCYRAVNETGGLNLRHSRRGEGLPSAYFLPWEEPPLGS